MTLALANLDGDLADPVMVGLLYAREPDLEVELEIIDEESWFEQEVVDDEPAAPEALWRQALRFLFGP